MTNSYLTRNDYRPFRQGSGKVHQAGFERSHGPRGCRTGSGGVPGHCGPGSAQNADSERRLGVAGSESPTQIAGAGDEPTSSTSMPPPRGLDEMT